MLDKLIRTREQAIPNRREFLNTIAKAAAASLLLPSCFPTPKRLRRPGVTKYNTLAHEFLDMELDLGTTIEDYDLLDEIIDDAKESVWNFDGREEILREEAVTALQSIDGIIRERGFKYKSSNLLNTGLKNSHLDCDSTSIIYIAIAEVMDLPIQLVRAPRHTFVRWHFNDDTYVNWETTNGKERTDKHYIKQHNIHEEAIDKVYLKSLSPIENREEITATQHVNIGTEKYWRCKIQKALREFNMAARKDPEYCEAYYNIGVVKQFVEEYDTAIEFFEYALRLNPNYTSAMSGLSNSHKELGNKDLSKKYKAMILETDPEYYEKKEEQPKRHMECGLSPSG